MNSISPEIKHLLREKKIQHNDNKKTIKPTCQSCDERAQNQIESYLNLILGRLQESQKMHDQLIDREQFVADMLKKIQSNTTTHLLFTEFDELLS